MFDTRRASKFHTNNNKGIICPELSGDENPFNGNDILDSPVLAPEELHVYSFEFAVRGALQRSAM